MSCYVSTIENQIIGFGESYPVAFEYEYWNNGGNDFKFVFSESRECTISLDLASMSVVVTEGVISGVSDIGWQADDCKVKGYKGGIYVKCNDSSPKEITVYSIDGYELNKKRFVSEAKLEVQNGCYIVVVANLHNQVLKTVKLVL